jgi:endonuclease/exonuclease/phosphatase family metal-dependent hydrolase
VHCARSNYRNAAREIAAALGMTCVFIVEFEELFSRRRGARQQGGGWHGNAVLTRLPVVGYHAVPHTHHPVDWEREGERMGEPRRGQRVTLCVLLEAQRGVRLAVYTAHLEVFCGILGRLRQFKDILADSHRLLHSHDCIHHQLIFGDLNTLGHGMARFHPRFCRDSLRWRTMGSSEAAWWHRNLFSFTVSDGPLNERLAKFRFADADLATLRNPHFYDPVPPLLTTLRSIRGFFQGRLDWTLVRGLRTVDYGLDNHDYGKSDHKLMWVELEFVVDGGSSSSSTGDPGPLCYSEQATVVVQLIKSDLRRRTFWLIIFLVAVLAFTFGSSMHQRLDE